jgi:hypothetical protein
MGSRVLVAKAGTGLTALGSPAELIGPCARNSYYYNEELSKVELITF